MGAQITKVADDKTISKETVEDTLENTVDMIATDLILKENFRDMVNLMNKEKCDELIILTADTLFKNFKNIDINFLKKRFKNVVDPENSDETREIPEEVMENMEVSVINKQKFLEMDSKNSNSEEKYELCVGIAKYYIQIAHLYAAIATTVNPTYTYSAITGKNQPSSCEEQAENFKIPSEIKVGGTPTPFMVTPGEMPSPTPGSVTPGSPTPGTVTPGSVTPGSPTPGTVTPGTPTPPTITPGLFTPETVTPGSPTPDQANPLIPTPEQLPQLKISNKINEYQTDLMGKSKLPSDVYITKTNIKGLCNARLASLANGMNLEDLDAEATITIKPTFCDMNKTTKIDIQGKPENKTLYDEPGIPELEGLYKDKYDYKMGEYVGLSPEMQEQYDKDLKVFYTAFTGNAVMPNDIKKFCQIPLREFHNTIGCSDKEAQFSNTQDLMGSRVYKAFDGSIMISDNGGTGMAQTLANVEGFTKDFIIGNIKNPPGQLYPQQEIEVYENDPSLSTEDNPKIKFINDYAGAYRREYTGTLKERLFKKYADHLIKMMKNAETQKKALLDNLRRVFIKNPNPSSGRLFIISNRLTSESLSDITDNVRDIIVKMYIDCETDFLEGIKLFDALIDKQILDEAISTKRQLTKSIKDDEEPDALTEFKDLDADINIQKQMTPEDIEFYTSLFNRYISENADGDLNPGLTEPELSKFIKELPINMTKNQKDNLFEELQTDNYVDIERMLEWLNSDDYRSLLVSSKKSMDTGSVFIETQHSLKTPESVPKLMTDQLKVSDNYLSLFPTVREKFNNIKFYLFNANVTPEQKGSATLNCCNMDMNITPSPRIIAYSTGYKNPPVFLEYVKGMNQDDPESFERNKKVLTDATLGVNYWFLVQQETNYLTDVEVKPSTPVSPGLQAIPPYNPNKSGDINFHSKRTTPGLDLAIADPKRVILKGGDDDDYEGMDTLFKTVEADKGMMSPEPSLDITPILPNKTPTPVTSDPSKKNTVILLWWFRNILETNAISNNQINPNINEDTTTIESIKDTNGFIRKIKPNVNYFEK